MHVKVQLTVTIYAQSLGAATAEVERIIKAGQTGASHPEVTSIDKVEEVKQR
jgi:hypothetical protein